MTTSYMTLHHAAKDMLNMTVNIKRKIRLLLKSGVSKAGVINKEIHCCSNLTHKNNYVGHITIPHATITAVGPSTVKAR